MRKVKLKKLPIFILFILILVIVIIIHNNYPRNTRIKVSVIDDVYNKIDDKNISKEFIEWVNKKYKNSISEMDILILF